MKKLLYIIPLLCMALVSCGGDDDNSSSSGSDSGNKNQNSTSKSIYATRLEVPKVMNGNNYLLLTRLGDGKVDVNYMVEWDCVKRAQRWTCWMWNKANSTKGWQRSNWEKGETFRGYGGDGDPFQPDTEIPAEYRTTLSDYSGSGYNRGHVCASEDRITSKEVNGQTFYLSNMQPMIYNFNGKVWSNMEIKVRNWRDAIVYGNGKLYIVKGGTIGDVMLNGTSQTGVLSKNPETGRSNAGLRMPVPKFFYMALLKETAAGTYSAMAFWAEHKPDNSTNLAPYMITIDELEARTGIDFFCNLPDKVENAVESYLDKNEWK